MLSRSTQTSERKGQYKKSVDQEESRRRREDQTISIRKQHREDHLNKNRKITTPTHENKKGDNIMSQRLENLQQMVDQIKSEEPEQIYHATVAFRKLLSIERSPPIEQVIETGIVPLLVKFLYWHDFPQLQFEAAWALTNIASGTPEQTRVVIENGAIYVFVLLLNSPFEDVREQSVWALGNIAGDSYVCRDLVLQQGALQPLLQQINTQLSSNKAKLSMVRNATWTLSNFCRGKPSPPFEAVRPSLPVLAKLIYFPDEEVLIDACWALSYLSDGSNERIQEVINANVCRKMVELLGHNAIAVQTPALRTIGNIVTGDDHQTQVVLSVSALQLLLNLLSSSKKTIRKEACWTISNITAGNQTQIQQVIDANIIPTLINLLSTAEIDIKKEAAWAISNATSGGSPQQIQYLVHNGCIRPLCDLLSFPDPRIVNVALEGLENILESGKNEAKLKGTENEYCKYVQVAEGVKKLQHLQQISHLETFEKANRILGKYFNDEDDEDIQVLIPEATGNHFDFKNDISGKTSHYDDI
ncbi:putative importin subunit alpha B [Tieghemostelium lacteum]|uniref:Importin subunit alpha n=1 Tax=Tieghemostelium lacteum TaxID=361077 RepID=A0A151ZDI2_TIELA|nr:putative importin subunit alpha B [Tieghemostelium lacteum]|eukprot:KYQ91985.1 putative importin subunit alpha B [Tieghemostelium lacteum]